MYTGALGEELSKYVESRTNGRLLVYFDHGPSRSKKIVAHLGDKPSRANNLSYVDIAVVERIGDPVGRPPRVVLLCEIEEEGARPKKIVGDLCNLIFAEGLSVGTSIYHLRGTSLLLGIRTAEDSMSEKKANDLIRRIRQWIDHVTIADIKCVNGSTYPVLMDAVRKEVLRTSGISGPEDD